MVVCGRRIRAALAFYKLGATEGAEGGREMGWGGREGRPGKKGKAAQLTS